MLEQQQLQQEQQQQQDQQQKCSYQANIISSDSNEFEHAIFAKTSGKCALETDQCCWLLDKGITSSYGQYDAIPTKTTTTTTTGIMLEATKSRLLDSINDSANNSSDKKSTTIAASALARIDQTPTTTTTISSIAIKQNFQNAQNEVRNVIHDADDGDDDMSNMTLIATMIPPPPPTPPLASAPMASSKKKSAQKTPTQNSTITITTRRLTPTTPNQISNNVAALQPTAARRNDFNSRRRRGRLRWTRWWSCEWGRVLLCWLLQLQISAAAIAVDKCARYIVWRSTLLLSLLLSFLIDYVNRRRKRTSIIRLLIGGQSQRHHRHLRQHHHCCYKSDDWCEANAIDISNAAAAADSYAITNDEEKKDQIVCQRSKHQHQHQHQHQYQNQQQQQQHHQQSHLINVADKSRNTINSNSKRSISSSAMPSSLLRVNSVRLIYAFILCTSILLPCSNNFVSAAKPKSATQLQQQQQHKQQSPPQNIASGVAFDSNGVGVLTPPSYQVVSSQTSNEEAEFLYPSSQSEERMFDEEQQHQQLNLNDIDEEEDEDAAGAGGDMERDEENIMFDAHGNESQPNITKSPLFPPDLFTKYQLEHGAVICHIIGVIYMFVALAIVCDEFFVPSLDVIIEKLDITDDVAGATFMAAGGSAPELFTSVIGVFISFDDVGIGTIVGSAVFNILFVIGMCALFSRTVLTLTWWPLFRDCTFYSISLMVLIYFFRDNFIFWWEATILFSIYIAYVAFMKWNVQVERFVKKLITKNKVTRVRSTDQLMPAGNAANSSETSMATQPGGSVTSRAASETRSGAPGTAGATGNSSGGTSGSTQTGAKFRHGLLQLMIHTIDPLHDDDVPGKVDEKATQLHAIASLKVLLDATKPQRGGATTSAANHVKINLKETTLADRPNGNIDTTLDSANDIDDEPEPLSMAWPDTARKRLTYIMVAPLLIPMWLTLPDTRTPRGKKYFPVTFIGSILWIAAFSYLMVWWANVAGDTARIPPEVMGLTFLAAGTSIPDLITSVIVARKGFGDMAVSSSVGSNIFDVTVGLPIPWLIYGIIYNAPVEVNSVGMVCSITILFMMLIFVVMSIAYFRWRMNKGLGFTMFLLYFVFVAVSLMFEYDIITCPV